MRTSFLKYAVILGLSGTSYPVFANPTLGTGISHTCTLTVQHTVKCWGSNQQGQLGDGTKNPHSVASIVENSPTHTLVVVGGTSHSCALDGDGTVKCWGLNKDGQAGDGTNQTYKTSLVSVVGLGPDTNAGQVRASAIASFGNHTCAIIVDGTVRCWGNNSNGQLGDGSSNNIRNTPVIVPGLTGVLAITAGEKHSCALKSSGQVWCWGNNADGQLGDGTSTQRTAPVQVITLTNAVAIAAGSYHTCAIVGNASKDVYCWGKNDMGQIGNGSAGGGQFLPTLIASNAIDLALGGEHSCALMSDNTSKCWGSNTFGQLGDGTKNDRLLPTLTQNMPALRSMSAGGTHTCGRRKTDDVTICWGNNLQGQLGNSSQSDSVLPVAVISQSTGGGGGYANGSSGVVATGDSHTCAIRGDQTLQCWGDNYYGQLGTIVSAGSTPVTVPGLSGVTYVSANFYRTCAVGVYNNTSGLYCWGYGNLGNGFGGNSGYGAPPQQVLGLSNMVVSQVVTGYLHNCAIGTDVTDQITGLYCWGSNNYNQSGGSDSITYVASRFPGLTNVTSVAVGSSHTCVIGKYNNSANPGLYCWGNNSNGQLGNGQTLPGTSNPTPTLVGLPGATQVVASGNTTCAVANNAVYCWGGNDSGQLGNNPAAVVGTSSSVPLQIPNLQSLNAIFSVGSDAGNQGYVCAAGTISGNTGLWCWGKNDYGQLGNLSGGGPTPTLVTGLNNPTAVSAGAYHTCAINSGILYCWGDNSGGKLGGVGGGGPYPIAVDTHNASAISQVIGGPDHTCGILDGSAYCWGSNGAGVLGSNTPGGPTPTPVQSVPGLSNNVTALAVGSAHTCALTNQNAMYCWGSNTYGQLGSSVQGGYVPRLVTLPNVTAIATGGDSTCAISNGSLYCWGNNANGEWGTGTAGGSSYTPQPNALGNTVSSIAMGYSHACAIANSTVYCWGVNNAGQLGYSPFGSFATPQPVVGLPTTVTGGTGKLAAGLQHTCVIADDSKLYCWGLNVSGQLGNTGPGGSNPTVVSPTILNNVTTVAAGAVHTCAINGAAISAVYCFGENLYGQLGSDTTQKTSVPTFVAGVSPVSALGTGSYHTCSVSGTALYCWGNNNVGQLGVGSLQQTSPVAVQNGIGATESLIYDVIFYEAGFGL